MENTNIWSENKLEQLDLPLVSETFTKPGDRFSFIQLVTNTPKEVREVMENGKFLYKEEIKQRITN